MWASGRLGVCVLVCVGVGGRGWVCEREGVCVCGCVCEGECVCESRCVCV